MLWDREELTKKQTNMNYLKEFKIDIKQVAKEVRQIREEKKVIYDEYGKAVPKRSYYQELRDRPVDK